MFNGNLGFVEALTNAVGVVTERVQRSLVLVESSRFGFGAGVIWRREGFIVTNHHIVRRGQPRVTLADGRVYPAHILAREEEVDLAVLQVEAGGLPAASIADGRGLQVGQLVLAVGHPWGQRGMVTAGVITGLGAVLAGAPSSQGRRLLDVIRSDVELAPGNSGGPLVNAAGGVIGINTMVVGGDLGVAIPSHVVEAFVEATLPTRVDKEAFQGATVSEERLA